VKRLRESVLIANRPLISSMLLFQNCIFKNSKHPFLKVGIKVKLQFELLLFFNLIFFCNNLKNDDLVDLSFLTTFVFVFRITCHF
jgi:hypothetical protein